MELGEELEQAIYSIFCNKFEHKLENKGAALMQKLEDLNPDYADSYSEYLGILNNVRSAYEVAEASSPAIKDWNVTQIQECGRTFKTSQYKAVIGQVDTGIELARRSFRCRSATTRRRS